MKNLSLKLFAVLFVSLLGYSLQAQQTVLEGQVKNYSVDTAAPDGGPNGTLNSTYTWTVTDATNTDITGTTMTITNVNPPFSNAVTIDWGTTPTGQYTLKVVETNATCIGMEKTIIVNIVSLGVIADDPTICADNDAEFTISGAVPNSFITFTVTGGTTPITPSPIQVDGSGNATIIVSHDNVTLPIANQIIVTLTSMEISGVVTPLTVPPATTNVTVIETTEITFD